MELNSFDEKCLEMLNALPNWHSKHYFRSAINHLELGEKLYPIDSSMGAFRYITAEEEAASGLIKCLIEKGYINAKKLNPQNHKHKHSIIPFFIALCQFIGERFSKYEITTDLVMDSEDGKNKIRLVVQMLENGYQTTFTPEPPLSFTLKYEGKRFSYKPQFSKLASSKGVSNIIKHIEDSANLRNKLLYASPEGYPSPISVQPQFFPAYQNRVLTLLRAYLMIVPYEEKLDFVQDALDAVLSMLGAIELDDIHNTL